MSVLEGVSMLKRTCTKCGRRLFIVDGRILCLECKYVLNNKETFEIVYKKPSEVVL